MKQMLIWIGALAVGAILGLLQVEAVDVIADSCVAAMVHHDLSEKPTVN